MYLSYCTLLILLHRPFIEKEGGEKTRSSLSSLSICTSAATRCVDVATSMHFRDFLLVSWNFAIYHVFTASLIHIHTVANSGSVVSDLAKGDLIKAIRVVKRLSNLSAAACQIHQVLLRLMKMRNIPYTDPSDDNSDNENGCREDQAKHSNKGRTKDKKASSASIATKARTNLSRPDTMATDTTTKSGMSPRISDVGRGQITHKLTARSPSADPPSTTVNSVQQPHDDRASSASSTPTSLTNGDWINGLYSSIQQEDNQGKQTIRLLWKSHSPLFSVDRTPSKCKPIPWSRPEFAATLWNEYRTNVYAHRSNEHHHQYQQRPAYVSVATAQLCIRRTLSKLFIWSLQYWLCSRWHPALSSTPAAIISSANTRYNWGASFSIKLTTSRPTW